MSQEPQNKAAKPSRRTLWLALASIVALIAWWELSVPRDPSPTVPLGTQTARPAGSELAVFAGGCFWCTEADFDKVPGVLSTTSGYTGGKTANPSYAEVSSHATGHAEAVQVVFDPKQVSYERLVAYFWLCDIGSPYRTVIFATTPEQFQVALASRSALEKSKPFKESIVTQIVMADDFYPAEPEHQNYHQNNPVRYG